MTASLTFTGTPNAAYTVPGTHTLYDDSFVYDGDGTGIVTSAAFSRLFDNAICSGTVSVEAIFDFTGSPSYWSNAAIIFMDSTLTGVKIEFRGDRLEINREVAGANGTNIYSAAATNTGVFTVLVELNIGTGAISVYKDSVLQTTSSYTDTLVGLRAGMQTYNDGSRVIINTLNTVTGGGGPATVDSYPATVRSGDTGIAYTTTGLTSVSGITIGSLAATSISDTAGDGTHAIPALVDETAHELYGTKTVTITGTGGAPTTTTSFLPAAGNDYIVLGNDIDYSTTGIVNGFSPAAVEFDELVAPSALELNARGQATGEAGTYLCWHIQASTKIARSYTVTYGGNTNPMAAWNGTTWEDGMLKYWDGSAWQERQLKRWDGTAWINVN